MKREPVRPVAKGTDDVLRPAAPEPHSELPGSQPAAETYADPLAQVPRRPADARLVEAHAHSLQRAMNSQSGRAPAALLGLQRAYGNRYVRQVVSLLSRSATDAAPDLSLQRKAAPSLQRADPPNPQITVKAVRGTITGDFEDYTVTDDIQWYFNKSGFWFDLVTSFPPGGLKTYSDRQVGAAGAAAIENSTTARFKPGKREDLAAKIASQMAEQRSESRRIYLISLDHDYFISLFEGTTWQDYTAQLQKSLGGDGAILNGEMFASGSFGGGAKTVKPPGPTAPSEPPGPAGSEPPAWTRSQQRELDALLAEARKQQPRPKDLPDRLVLWYNERNQSWYLNVFVYLDPRGRVKQAVPVRLRAGEEPDALLERVRAAAAKALENVAAQQQASREQELPKWAQDLKRKLAARLDELRRQEKTTDFPDGLELIVENRAAGTAETAPAADAKGAAAPAAPRIFMRVWVERGTPPKTERNNGTLPYPLSPQTPVEELVPYARRIAAILREFEQTPAGPHQPPKDVQIVPAGAVADLRDFPALLAPVDLRPDHITVTGAENKFQMELDFESVYGGGPAKDLYIASKLSQQYIHFYWKIFNVPDNLKPAEGETEVPQAWGPRWAWLYKTFNPGADPNRPSQRDPAAAPQPGALRFEDNGSELSSRVEFPDQPGDYLVFCQTGHAPIGENKLKRASSWAYYPVRVQPIKAAAAAEVSVRPEATAAASAEVKTIEALLAGNKLDATNRQRLESLKKYKTAELGRLRAREAQTLTQNLDDDIKFADETVAKLDRLDRLLPGIIERAKSTKLAPSQLLEDQQDLLDLYWYLISESKTLEGYRNELQAQAKQMRQLRARAGEFQGELKGSPYSYAPETAFVSQVTGQIYPLVLMIGEAPDSVRNRMPGAVVAYTVADITSAQTQKRYYGYSVRRGPAGHREAIDNAFEEFGKDATYGKGIIAVRIPPGPAGADDPNHPGTDTKFYQSKEGILQKVLFALGIIGAVVGLAALAATGVGAPAAAAILGAVAAGMGAIAAIHNISERSARHKLEWDAEMALDIIGIIAVIPAGAAARLATLERAVAGLQFYRVTGTFLEIYGYTELGATVVLVPAKLHTDIKRIEEDKELTPDEKKLMIAQAELGALQSGLMLIGGVAAAREGHAAGRVAASEEPPEALTRQIELVDLEGLGGYESLQERGLLDAEGRWTDKAREILRAAPPGVKPGKTAGEPGGPAGKIPGEVPPLPEGGEIPAAPPRQPSQEQVERLKHVREVVDELPATTVVQYATPTDPRAALTIYNNAVSETPAREAAVYRNSETGAFIVVQGDESAAYVAERGTGPGAQREAPRPAGHAQGWKEILDGQDVGRWELVAHYHPVDPQTGVVAVGHRYPSGGTGDVGILMSESRAAGGAPRRSRINYQTDEGPAYTDFGYDPNAAQPLWIEIPGPAGRRQRLEFANPEEYHRWYRQTFGVDLGPVPAELAAPGGGGAPAQPPRAPGAEEPPAPGQQPKEEPAPKPEPQPGSPTGPQAADTQAEALTKQLRSRQDQLAENHKALGDAEAKIAQAFKDRQEAFAKYQQEKDPAQKAELRRKYDEATESHKEAIVDRDRLSLREAGLQAEIDRTQAELDRTLGRKAWERYKYDDIGKVDPCFPPGTLVHTPDGTRRIETLGAGDLVYAYDPAAREVVAAPVVALFSNATEHLVDIDIDAEIITATCRHRFWSATQAAWVMARELQPGTVLRPLGPGPATVVDARVYPAATPTYNLEVLRCHNYFVGAAGVLVHNGAGDDSRFASTATQDIVIYAVYLVDDPNTIIYEGQTYLKPIERRLAKHIAERTMPDGTPWKQYQDKLRIRELKRLKDCTFFEAAVWEKHFHDQLLAKGHPLQNDPQVFISEKSFKAHRDRHPLTCAR